MTATAPSSIIAPKQHATAMLAGVASDEAVVLAALLESQAFGVRYAGRLDSSMFSDPLHRALADHALQQIRVHGCASWQCAAQDIAAEGRYAMHDIAGEVVEVLQWHPQGGPASSKATMAVERLLGQQRERELREQAQSIAASANSDDASSIIAYMERAVSGYRTHRPDATLRLADTLKTDPADDADTVIETGIDWLDDLLPSGGLGCGELVPIAGDPGTGKTALALQVALSAIDKHDNLSVVWGMGEMHERALRNRALQCLSGLTLGVLRRPWSELSPLQESAKREAIAALQCIGERLHILPAPLTPSRIEAAIVANDARLLIVDYVQLCQPDKPGSSRRDDIDSVIKSFCAMAQRHDIAVMAISNMSKGSGAQRDIYSAFKETSELAFAADAAYVGEWLNVHDDDAKRGSLPNVVDVRWRCLKARHGAQRDIFTRFNRPIQQFSGVQS